MTGGRRGCRNEGGEDAEMMSFSHYVYSPPSPPPTHPSLRLGFGMNWRFLVADDISVNNFIIRDADSRVSLRDRWAIDEWLHSESKKPFHVVRDHPSHANYPLMGGTWGARASVFRGPLQKLSAILAEYYSTRPNAQYGSDIDFLTVRERESNK